MLVEADAEPEAVAKQLPKRRPLSDELSQARPCVAFHNQIQKAGKRENSFRRHSRIYKVATN